MEHNTDKKTEYSEVECMLVIFILTYLEFLYTNNMKKSKMKDLHHSLYADDITLWIGGGSDGHIQDALQNAVDTVREYARERGLDCSPEKSELLVYPPRRVGDVKETRRIPTSAYTQTRRYLS